MRSRTKGAVPVWGWIRRCRLYPSGLFCRVTQGLSKGLIVQGPLKSTSEDFWQMVFEQRSTAVLMLTRTTENFHEKVTLPSCPGWKTPQAVHTSTIHACYRAESLPIVICRSFALMLTHPCGSQCASYFPEKQGSEET